jgi:hypothetical protein
MARTQRSRKLEAKRLQRLEKEIAAREAAGQPSYLVYEQPKKAGPFKVYLSRPL